MNVDTDRGYAIVHPNDVALVGSLLFESVYRHTTGRTFREILTATDPAPAPAAPTAR